MYLASKLHKKMDVLFPPEKFIGKKVKYSEISKLLNQLVKPLGAKARVVKDYDIKIFEKKRELFDFSGYYDTFLEKNNICITLHVHPERDVITFTKAKYNNFRFILSQLIQHEFIHKSQFTFRPDQAERVIKVYHSDKLSAYRLDYIDYFREWCEVEAYAHNIAMEIRYYYPDKNPETVIKNIDKYRNISSYKKYKQAFAGTNWDRLRQSLLKKAWKWLPSAHVPTKI